MKLAYSDTAGRSFEVELKIVGTVHYLPAGVPRRMCELENIRHGWAATNYESDSADVEGVNCKRCVEAAARMLKAMLPRVEWCRYKGCVRGNPVTRLDDAVTCPFCLATMGDRR